MGEPDRPKEPTTEGTGQQPTIKEKTVVNGEGEEDVTSIKNEITKSRRNQFGLKEEEETIRKDFGTTWDEAKKKIDDGFNTQDLVDELKRKPRPTSDVEDALLLHHQNEREIQLLKTNEQINKAAESGNESLLAEAKIRRARLLDELQEVYDVNKSSGRELGRGLAARKMMIDRKYNLVNMMTDIRAANDGKPLTEEQTKEVEKLHQKIKDTQAAFDDYVKSAEKEIKELQEKILSKKVVDKKTAANKLREWADKLEKNTKGQTFATIIPVTPKMVADAMRLIAYGLDKGEDVLGLIKKAVDEIKKLHPNVDEEKLNKEINKEVINSGIIAPTKENKILKDISEITLNRKAIHLKAEAQRAKDEFDIKLKKEEAKNRPMSQKIQDTFIQWQRAFKLSNPVTMGKLFMAAVTRATTTPAEDIVGGAWTKILPKSLTIGAIGEGGGLHVKETADAYKNGIIEGMKDSYEIMRRGGHGKSDLDVLFSKHAHLPPEAIDFFGQLHSATKAPIKRVIFERSLSKRLRRSIAAGMDVSNPMVQSEIALGAYKDANRAIFMQDNKVSTGWQKMVNYLDSPDPKTGENNTKFAATLMQWLVPFVKVPTNIAAEIGTNVYGVPVAAAKILHGAFTKGLENLSADEKDTILRNLKKGTLGAAALTLGYMNPQIFGGYYQDKEKRKPSDAKAGAVKLFGMNIPAWFIESPIFQAMQVGATVRRVKDTVVKGETKGIGEGAIAGAIGLAQHVPMIDQPMRILGAIKSPTERNWYFDELAKSTLEPSLLQKIAEFTDTEDKRKPQDLKEHLEAGIPGLRENVTSAIGLKDKNSKEYKFLKDKESGIVPYHKEKLQPVDIKGNEIKVTDENYKKFIDERENYIKNDISRLINGELKYANKDNKEKPVEIPDEELLKLPQEEQLKYYQNEAKYEISQFANKHDLSKDEVQKLTPEELNPFLMTITKQADKKAMWKVFKGVEKEKPQSGKKIIAE